MLETAALAIDPAAQFNHINPTVTAVRALREVMGYHHSLAYKPREAPWFYAVYTIALIVAAATVASGANLVTLGVGTQVMNGSCWASTQALPALWLFDMRERRR